MPQLTLSSQPRAASVGFPPSPSNRHPKLLESPVSHTKPISALIPNRHYPELETDLTHTKQVPDPISNRQYFALLKLPDGFVSHARDPRVGIAPGLHQRRAAKNVCSRAAASSAQTPAAISTR